MKERVSGVGSRLSGKDELPTAAAPTTDNRQPTTQGPNWPLLYGAVLAELLILIIIFYAFTRAFA